MSNNLESTKGLLRRKFIGKYGIHGFGIRKSVDAICIYMDEDTDQQEIIDELKEAASPHQIIIVKQERPSIR